MKKLIKINLIEKIKNNSEYLWGLFFVLLVNGIFIGLFFNKTLCMQEGWYHVYVKEFLSGLIPYKDFPIIVPPFSLFTQVLMYKFLGHGFIISHYLGFIERLILSGLMYHIFTRFFSKPNSAYATIAGGVFLISIIFDNACFTYNELGILIALLGINLFLNFVENIEKNNEIDYKNLIWFGVVNGFACLNKQSFGVIAIFSSTIMLSLLLYKKFGTKELLKPLSTFLVSYAIISGLPLIYLALNGALFAFIDNVFLTGVSGKGNIKDLIFFYFKFLGSPEYMWLIWIFILSSIFLYMASKNKQFIEKKYNDLKFFSISIFAAILVIFSAYNFVKYSPNYIIDLSFIGQINFAFMQIGAIAIFFITILAFYYFCKILFEDKFNLEDARKFILYCSCFFIGYSWSLSGALPNCYCCNIALAFAIILNYKIIFNTQKNFLIYLFILAILFFGVTLKLTCPYVWHCWVNGKITEPHYSTNIKILDGLYLTSEEVHAIKGVKAEFDKYTNKNDKIFIYNNLPAFYEILDRKPYTKNFTHFWDLCPDEYATNDAKIISMTPPPAILYLQFPEDTIKYQEYLFRNSHFAGQRNIDQAILNMEKNGTYVLTKKYESKKPKYENYIHDKKLLKKYKNAKSEFAKLSYQTIENNLNYKNDPLVLYKKTFYEKEFINIQEEIDRKYKLNSQKNFLLPNYELKVLIRKDLYDKHNKK